MNLLGWIKYLELVTAIAGIIFYRKYSNSNLKYFVYMLWFIVLVEFAIGTLKQYTEARLQNNYIYNVLTSLQYAYYFFLYYSIITIPRYRQWVLTFLVMFVVAVVVNFLWIQKLSVTAAFASYTFTLGAILLMMTIALFLVEILNTEKILYFKNYLMFWISIGLFVFYTGIIPFVLSINLLPDFLSNDALAIMFFTLNLVMYSCFTLGFIISRPQVEGLKQ
ncbi:hypothetical protein DQQ10_23365 [Pseudochryseolinea flava]|uniref:Uncharacterized protein n=2 Tax=Pseudochryseolinea flava TaxID=2059302 RepID=A0A364XXG4_9BACT|nr:hypothetical protein DQQ10_23365 [Pseudochryseolinea flava]